MIRGQEIVKTWEYRQSIGRYRSYSESIADLASLIDSIVVEPVKIVRDCITREIMADVAQRAHEKYIIDMTYEAQREEEFQMAMHGYVGQD